MPEPTHAYRGHISYLLKSFPKKGLPSTDVSYFRRLYYERNWGICQHTEEDGDLSIVAYQNAESVYEWEHPYKRKLRQYITYQVNKYTGLDFNEFLKLTPIQQKTVFDVCSEMESGENSQKDKEMREFEDAFKKA